MKGKRVFTDSELRDMEGRTLDRVLEAIESGDKPKAKDLANRMYREFSGLHDGFISWITTLQTYIYNNYGIEVLEKAEREAHSTGRRFVFKSSGNPDLRARIEGLAGGLRGHLQPITVTEDDEKVTLSMNPCGSGERIIQMGGYEPEIGLARVKEAHPITWGQQDFPIHCVHCPIVEMLDIEMTGDFGYTHFVPDPIGKEHCQFVFYKDSADIPEEFYTRIGKVKPPA